jgi:fibronectin-binding autotransporter adhesin
MKTRPLACQAGLAFLFVLAASESTCPAGTVTWDNSDQTHTWSTPANWDNNVEPLDADDVVFPSGLGAAITLASGEKAKSLRFDDSYVLGSGSLTLPGGGGIQVAGGITATINTPLTVAGGLNKNGTGTLVLGGSNTNFTGTLSIVAGTLRVNHANAAGSSTSNSVEIQSGSTLEVGNGISFPRNLSLSHGGTVAGTGTAATTGILSIDPAATSVTLGTSAVSDVLTIGNAANELTGGSATTVVGIAGAGTVQLSNASNFDGSWKLTTGSLGLANATALGDTNTASVTLQGGTLAGRSTSTSALNFTGSAGNNLFVTADSSLLSDRTTAGTAGATFTFGSLAIGSHTLTVGPGPNVTSGTAGITLGDITLSGNPQLAVNDLGSASGRLVTGSWLGGGAARTIIKSGGGDLTVTGGSTELPAGSQFTASGGGTITMLFPPLGSDAIVAIAATQNPFGESTIQVTDGALRLLANGNGSSTAQTYVLPSAISLGGSVTLDPFRQSGSGSNKTFRLPGLTLAPGTNLAIAGDYTHGIALTGKLVLQGSATLRGADAAGMDGLLALDAGISGDADDALALAGGTSPLALTINGASTFGGGTTMSGGTVTLNAASALGNGPLTLAGGVLTVNSDGAIVGPVVMTGGTLRINDIDALAGNAIQLGGGTLDLRANVSSSYTTGALSLTGPATLNVGNNGSGSTQTISLPALNVTGSTVLTLTSTSGYIPDFSSIALSGDLTLNHAITAQVQTISEDAHPRRLIKAGTGILKLQGAGTHSGGTEALAGTLLIEHPDALGGGTLALGDTSGSSAATVQVTPGISIANHLLCRNGSSGTLTLDAPSGGATWAGTVELERTLTLDNGGSAAPLTVIGRITGTGSLIKTGSGPVSLTNSSNDFIGTGVESVRINAGTLVVTTDGALGHPANGVTIAGVQTSGSTLKADGSFTSSRPLNFLNSYSSIYVTSGNVLTLASTLSGSGGLTKGDSGTLAIAASANGSGRGSAATNILAGTLRLHAPNTLSAGGPIHINSGSGTIELMSDPDTGFGHPLTVAAAASIHIDRAPGGSRSNGRHSLPSLTFAGSSGGSVNLTTANGYGLRLDELDFKPSTSGSLANNGTKALEIGTLTSSATGTVTRDFNIGGSGDTRITGVISQSDNAPLRLTKTGPGALIFGTTASGFGAGITVEDGLLDLNGLDFSTAALTLGGAASALGPRIITGDGALVLAGGLTYSFNSTAAGALFTGDLDLTDGSHVFNIGDSPQATTDVVIDGAIRGNLGSTISKTGNGTLRFTGAGNSLPGPVTLGAGLLELAKSGGAGIGSGGLFITGGTARLLAGEQIDDTAPVGIDSANTSLLELDDHVETIGSLSLAQSDSNDFSAVRTGASGTLVLRGNVVFANNTSSSGDNSRRVLITGSGGLATPANDGTLDLGGAVRSVHVTSSTALPQYAAIANATIETRIINGGILKTGARTLYLTHPSNDLPGGIQIAEGAVNLGNNGLAGIASVSFANTGAADAMIMLSNSSGPVANALTVGGSGTGSSTISYTALSPGNLEWNGNITLQRDLTIQVVNGTTSDGNSAILNLTGRVDDGGGTWGLIKTGDGTLKLAPGNIYSGSTTIRRGILRIADPTALGNGTAPLVFDGGCLDVSSSFELPRDILITNGGSVHVDAPHELNLSGAIDWGIGALYFYGSGRTVLSGNSAGSGGDLTLGIPGPFATVRNTTSGFQLGHVLSLQGGATLPDGNLRIINDSVLELGNSDFTRPLGTAAGEIRLDTSRGAGWAARGTDRVVNLGGAGAGIVWGQTTPPFLYQSSVGQLILGSAGATHTVDFRNALELNNGETLMSRSIIVPDGPAALEARISGNINLTPSAGHTFTNLKLQVAGALEITGNLTGPLALTKLGTGTATLSGANTFDDGFWIDEGTLVIAKDDSFGGSDEVEVSEGAHLDVGALTTPIQVDTLDLYGTIIGDVEVIDEIAGYGTITGDLTAMAGAYIKPDGDAPLRVGGDFTLAQGVTFWPFVNFRVNPVESGRMSVAGAVHLAGTLDFDFYGTRPAVVATYVAILNDGNDPIIGTFDGLPEGALIPFPDGSSLRVTYLANGDGGAVGNDFGVTYLPEGASGADLALTVAAPLAVATGDSFAVTFTIGNIGSETVNDGLLRITLPTNATFNGSTPAGIRVGDELSVIVPPLTAGASSQVGLGFTAPALTSAVNVSAAIEAAADTNPANNTAQEVIAALAGGQIELKELRRDPATGKLALEIDTLEGVNYRFENSIDLIHWTPLDMFTGDGLPYQNELTPGLPREFFRFLIVP